MRTFCMHDCDFIRNSHQEETMKYGIAWLLGVPPVLIVGWMLVNAC